MTNKADRAPDSADGTEVYVRMYRALEPASASPRSYQGMLGDCFLIRIVHNGQAWATIMIDCGILMGSVNATERMKAIVADIRKVSHDTLDLVVVTHEHWDHISGFSQASELFFGEGSLGIRQLWLAWTEDPQDPSRVKLDERIGRRAQAFAALAQRLRESQVGGAPLGARPEVAFDGLDAFLGPLDAEATASTPDGLAAAAQGRLKGRAIIGALKDKVTGEGGSISYLSPGEVATGPGGMRAFVLGPPRDFDKLFKDMPSAGAARETYLTSPGFEQLLLDVAGGEAPDPARDSPFGDRFHRLRSGLVRPAPLGIEETGVHLDAGDRDAIAWLAERYYAHNDSDGRDQSRRGIDTDWLAAAGPLALKLDSDTNNTSLVLAFELPDQSLLLFPGDAQVGNWLSWHDQPYVTDGASSSARDLLGRVRFYKVGHHGSHNATLDELGLALMTRDDLVAAIPTDEAFGRKQGRSGWQMPNPRVWEALLNRTQGRVIRNDRSHDPSAWTSDPDTARFPSPGDFFERLAATDLYLEYRVHG